MVSPTFAAVIRTASGPTETSKPSHKRGRSLHYRAMEIVLTPGYIRNFALDPKSALYCQDSSDHEMRCQSQHLDFLNRQRSTRLLMLDAFNVSLVSIAIWSDAVGDSVRIASDQIHDILTVWATLDRFGTSANQGIPLRSSSNRHHSMAYPADPVNPVPGSPLIHGYSYHSALPESASTSVTDGEGAKVPWIMGIDEAGRGRECHLLKWSFSKSPDIWFG